MSLFSLRLPVRPYDRILRGQSDATPRLLPALNRLIVALVATLSSGQLSAQDLKYPQIITIKYEAQDRQSGGHFIIWVEREKIWYGLDQKLYPPALSVEVTHITPAAGTTVLTMIAVTRINSSIPDYFHLSGNVRFKVTGMRIVSSNIP
jgi:hypothetical protein